MGQCGCCDFQPDYQFPGPDGSIYTLTIDTGCSDCDRPDHGIVIHKLSGIAMEEWDVKSSPPLPGAILDESDMIEWRIPTLSIEQVTDKLMNDPGDMGMDDSEWKESVVKALKDSKPSGESKS